jgi:N-acetylmuramoyl-L-alanine amidase
MSITKEKLNSSIETLRTRARSQSAEVDAAAQAAINRFNAVNQTKLGQDLNELNGFVPITQSADHSYDLVPGDAVCFMSENVPGLAADLVETVDNKVSLDAIVGASEGPSDGEIKDGFLKEFAQACNPKAIKESLVEATGKTEDQLTDAIDDLTSPELRATLTDTIKKGLDTAAAIASEFKSDVVKLEQRLAATQGTGAPNILEAVVLEIDKTITTTLKQLVGGAGISPVNLDSITKNISLELPTEIEKAVNLLKTIAPDIPVDNFEEGLSGLSTSVSNAVVLDPLDEDLGTSTVPAEIIGAGSAAWDDANTPIANTATVRASPEIVAQRSEILSVTDTDTENIVIRNEKTGSTTKITTEKTSVEKSIVTGGGTTTYTRQKPLYGFTYVSSMEELEAELRSVTRDITEVVVHWSATFLDQDIGAEEIHEWHTQRGFSGCGYHYVIRKDGRIQRGRPISKRGSHAKDNSHNLFSVGICFVGGYNCLSGTPNRDRYVGSESINEEQMKTFDKFMKCFYDVFPGSQAWGHVDTDDKGKQDPGFDVPQYVFNKFGKVNVSATGKTRPLSPRQLAKASIEINTGIA